MVECVSLVVLLWCNTYSVGKMQQIKGCIDDQIVKQAWLQTKTNMLHALSVHTPADFVSYQEWWMRRYHLINHIRLMKGKTPIDLPENSAVAIEMEQRKQKDCKTPEKILSEIQKWVDVQECDLSDLEACLSLLYDVDQALREQYTHEYEMII